jgi:hypothetical protein
MNVARHSDSAPHRRRLLTLELGNLLDQCGFVTLIEHMFDYLVHPLTQTFWQGRKLWITAAMSDRLWTRPTNLTDRTRWLDSVDCDEKKTQR